MIFDIVDHSLCKIRAYGTVMNLNTPTRGCNYFMNLRTGSRGHDTKGNEAEQSNGTLIPTQTFELITLETKSRKLNLKSINSGSII